MVDLHTHILPCVDDGAESPDDAIEMLSVAYKNGTTDIVLTPHYLNCDIRSFGFSKQQLTERFNVLQKYVKQKLPGLNVYFGAETFAASNISEYLKQDQLIPIANTNYILMEFGFDDTPQRALEITKMLTSSGYRILMAHPERYDFFLYDPLSLLPFLDEGVLLQLNASSLMGTNGYNSREMALSLIDSGLAAVIASDSHSIYSRSPDLSEAYSFVCSEYSIEHAEALFVTNPMTVLKNGTII